MDEATHGTPRIAFFTARTPEPGRAAEGDLVGGLSFSGPGEDTPVAKRSRSSGALSDRGKRVAPQAVA